MKRIKMERTNLGQIFLVCGRCNAMKEQFFMDEKFSFSSKNGNVCKDCSKSFKEKKKKAIAFENKNPIAYRNISKYWPGISGKEASKRYRKMLKTVNYKCQICRQKQIKPRLSIDHCHRTGRVRGLLCTKCNHALGLLGDSKSRLIDAIEYLENNRHIF